MSADMTTDLLKRLEAGEKLTAEQLWDLCMTFFPKGVNLIQENLIEDAANKGDLNAAVALVERVRPKEVNELVREAITRVGDKYALHIRFWSPDNGSYGQAVAAALIAALLKAKRADSGTEKEG